MSDNKRTKKIMGNCQAAEIAAVVLQHPGNAKVDRMYWPISANEVMSSNPGYYVALVVEPSHNVSGNAHPPLALAAKHQLKLLRPTDILHVGHVYRLITFEDVIKEFSAKKSVKLGKLLKESGILFVDKKNKSDAGRSMLDQTQIEQEDYGPGSGSSRRACSRRIGRLHGGGGHWKPALQSIAEFGS